MAKKQNAKSTYSYKKKLVVGALATTIAFTGGVLPSLEGFGIGSPSIVAHAAEVEGDFEYIDQGDGTAAIIKFKGAVTDNIVIPDKIAGLTVTTLGVIGSTNNLDRVYNTSKPHNLTLPDTVTSIGGYAFSFGSNMTLTNGLPDNLTYIGRSAFQESRMPTLVIPDKVEYIGPSAFQSSALVSLTIGKNVTEIGASAFYGNNIPSIVIPDNVEIIGDKAFSSGYASSITSLSLGSGVKEIGFQAFKGIKVTSLNLPVSLTTIGNDAFRYATLTEITIPKNVESIGDNAFESNALTSLVMQNGSTKVGPNAFAKNKLTELVIPDGVTSIADGAYASNELTTLTIPKGITSVGSKAFANNKLTEVTIEGQTTRLEDNTFIGNQATSTNLVMYVPNPSIAKTYAERMGYTVLDYEAPEEPVLPEPEPEEPEIPTIPEGNTESSENAGFNIGGGLFELATSKIKSFGNIIMPTKVTSYDAGFEGPFNVKDFSGKQQGWRVDVAASQFSVVEPKGGFKDGTEANVLPIGTLALNGVSDINRIGDGDSEMPTSKISNPTIIDDGSVTVVSAGVGSGMGEFEIVFPADKALTLTLDPKTIKLDSKNYPNATTPYEATVSWDLIQAP